MDWLRQIRFRILGMFRRRKLEADMAEEIRTHLAHEEAANRAAGMTLEEAQQAARRQFGGIDQVKEMCRDQRGMRWLERLAWDSRFATRQLRQSPGFTTAALVTLALGIGVNTTAFTVLNRLLLQSLPFRDPSTLVQVWTTTLRDGRDATSPADYFDERDQNTVFADVAAWQPWGEMSYAEAGKAPIRLGVINMTANLFPILGVRPELGRTPSGDETMKASLVCLISDSFWRGHFSSDPNVIGRSVRVDSRVITVIGVMPPSLDDPALFPNRPSFFILDPATHNPTYRRTGQYAVVARLKPGVSVEQAQAGMTVVARRLAHDYPDTNKDREFEVVRYPTTHLDTNSAQLTWTTLALSILVLLIACINLANLQIVRVTRRGHEISVRLALGCSRQRLMGMFVLESLIVSLLGGTLGIAVAVWSNAFIARYVDVDMPVNLRVFAFTFLASGSAALLFGMIPAWLASRTDIGVSLKTDARGSTSNRSRHWLRQGLVLLELAMSLTLLAGAGFFVGGLYRLTHRSLGWEETHETIGIVTLDQEHFRGDQNRAKVIAFGSQALEALRSLPGVQYAALSVGLPAWGGDLDPYLVEGRPAPEKGHEPRAGFFAISPGWFDVFGIHLLEGRAFTDADGLNAPPVAIVDESMARSLWPGESAIGKRIADTNRDKLVWAEVVGVVRDFEGEREFNNPDVNAFKFLRPWAQDANREIAFAVRTSGPPGPIKESVRKAIGALLPDLALTYLATIDEDVADTYSYFSFVRRILIQMAILGLLLSAVGIYGVVANLAAERTREIGIRMALGAQPTHILWFFVRGGLLLSCSGAALGLLGGFAVVTLLGRIMPTLPGKNPFYIAIGAVLLVSVATFACWLPARRTTKIDPRQALGAN